MGIDQCPIAEIVSVANQQGAIQNTYKLISRAAGYPLPTSGRLRRRALGSSPSCTWPENQME
jgi:hypothetical protein